MALNIRNSETEKLANTLAKLTGTTKTRAVTEALRDKLAQIKRQQGGWRLADELDEIAQHCSSLRVLDNRDADEILGFDEHGVAK